MAINDVASSTKGQAGKENVTPKALIGRNPQRGHMSIERSTPMIGFFTLNLVQKKHTRSATRNATLAIRMLIISIQRTINEIKGLRAKIMDKKSRLDS
ncbi:hypothetical protein Tco_0895843 [Tanacetum coccineum]|uniref:Uncharacterized protein n=1 Tax=Tanacetum coccineum TaxID=301880 RepID=A0ABQ5CJ58_9ASTR